MGIIRVPMTKEQFEILTTEKDWELVDVPSEHWDKIPGLQRRQDTYAVLASGTYIKPQTLNKIHSHAGIDVLTLEAKRKINEPEGNAYHYVVERKQDTDPQYVLIGPFKTEARVRHWHDVQDLNNYWKEPDDEE